MFVGCVPTAARNGTSVGLRFFVVQKILHTLTGGREEPKTWQVSSCLRSNKICVLDEMKRSFKTNVVLDV